MIQLLRDFLIYLGYFKLYLIIISIDFTKYKLDFVKTLLCSRLYVFINPSAIEILFSITYGNDYIFLIIYAVF